MNSENLWNAKVRQARQGSAESVNWLTQEAQGKICEYIYRITLDIYLSYDLTQETLLPMIKPIKNLNEEENFWPWLYRITQSKIQKHYRSKKRKAAIAEDSFYKDFLSRRGDIYEDENLRELLQKDLLKNVIIAMKELKHKERSIISLRCFNNLSYAEIANTFNCNEVSARIMFYRAKQALRKKLSNKGISGNLMIMSLGLFRRLTLLPGISASVSEGSISKASLQVGPAATILSNIFSKKTAAIVTVIIILFFLISGKDKEIITSRTTLMQREEIFNFNSTMNFNNIKPDARRQSKDAYIRRIYNGDIPKKSAVTFFREISRPLTGLHTIDTVCRHGELGK